MSIDNAWQQRLSSLFLEVEELTPAEREARLAEYSDPRVADEVRGMFQVRESRDLHRLRNLGSAVNARIDGVPKTFGNFKRLRELGRGGMGQVYLCLDVPLDRHVAAKAIPASKATHPERIMRFEHEARTLGSLNHPNIATVYGLEKLNDGRSVLIMEYVGAKSLRDRLNEGPLPDGLTERISTQIADALATAHAARIAHRDLKPENIVFADDDLVKVLDFGLAARLRGNGADAGSAETVLNDEVLTESVRGLNGRPRIMGTPGYMSPEQARGGRVDERGDIFAFGCVIYECLTGRPAFDGETREERIAANLLARPDLAQLDACDGRLSAIVRDCLQRDSDDRPQSMTEVLDSLGSSARPPSASASATNLPVAMSTLVGRVKELRTLRGLLASSRLITLTGASGIGKTRLAGDLGRTVIGDYPEGVWLVEADALTDGAHVAAAIADVLGIEEQPGQGTEATLATACRDRHTMVILDHVDQVREPVGRLVGTLLSRCPSMTMVVTSRETLRVPGEQVVGVTPLSLPPEGVRPTVESAMDSQAVRLFIERASRVRPGFELTPGRVDPIVSICRRLDGLPLAIELAAARIKSIGLNDLAERVGRDFQLLRGGADPLTTTMDRIYHDLTAEQRALFEQMSVFRGGWTLAACEELAPSPTYETAPALLSDLVDKSLVQFEERPETGARYRFLEIVREYARGKLLSHRTAGDIMALDRSHAERCVALAARCVPGLAGRSFDAWHEIVHTERENMLSALERCRNEPEWTEIGLRLATGLHRYWCYRGRPSEGREWIRVFLERRDSRGDLIQADALNALGVIVWHQGEHPLAADCWTRSGRLYDSLGHPDGHARASSNLGIALANLGRMDDARAAHERAIGAYRESNDEPGAARANLNLAALLIQNAEYEDARVALDGALVLFRRDGDRERTAATLHNIAECHVRSQGDLATAATLLRESLEMKADIGNEAALPVTVQWLGIVEAYRELPEEAARILGLAERLRTEYEAKINPSDEDDLDRAIASVRDALEPDRMRALWDEIDTIEQLRHRDDAAP